MKILQLVTKRQRRGAEVFAAQLADGLARLGHEVIFAALFPSASNDLVTDTAEVRDLTGRSGSRLSMRLIPELRRLIQLERPDLVQANGSATLKHVALTKLISRGSWHLVYRNIGIASDWLHYPGHRYWGRGLLAAVDHVAAVSEASLSDFRGTYRIPGSKISTIPIGVEVPASTDARRARAMLASLIGCADRDEIIAHVGSFTPEKNHLWLLEAFSEIAMRRPTARLVLIGEGPLRGRVETEVDRRGLGTRVHLLGSRDDAATLVGGADLFVLPSATEGIPGALLEASAQSVPVVATDVGSVREAMEGGRTGVLVEPGALDAFARAVIDLLASPARRQEMGAAGRTLVQERYDLDRIVARFEALYITLGAGRSSAGKQSAQARSPAGSRERPRQRIAAGLERP
jgi:L-malate glycosyltransferase